MPFAYPVMIEVAHRRCVVIGDDAVREGKVEGLLAAGADDVSVIAPGPAAQLDALARVAGVTVRRRGWVPVDLDGAFLVLGASRDPDQRAAIAREARARHVLVNIVDDIPNCDFAAPAVVRRGDLVMAVGTGGASPALAKQLRRRLANEFGEEWAEVLRVLRDVREQTSPSLPDFGARARRWADALDPDEAAALVREGRADELRARLCERLLGAGGSATSSVLPSGQSSGRPSGPGADTQVATP
jgi:siroheme synthase-like protein